MTRVIHIHLNAPVRVRDAAQRFITKTDLRLPDDPVWGNKAGKILPGSSIVYKEAGGFRPWFHTGAGRLNLAAQNVQAVDTTKDKAFQMSSLQIGQALYDNAGQKVDEIQAFEKRSLGGGILVYTRAGYKIAVENGTGRNAQGWTNVKPADTKDSGEIIIGNYVLSPVGGGKFNVYKRTEKASSPIATNVSESEGRAKIASVKDSAPEVQGQLNSARKWEVKLQDGTIILAPTAQQLVDAAEKKGYTATSKADGGPIVFRKKAADASPDDLGRLIDQAMNLAATLPGSRKVVQSLRDAKMELSFISKG